MLSYVAHIPSSPVLLENISRHKFSDFKKLNQATQKIAKDISSKECETIITITPNGYGNKQAYILNVCPDFNIGFEDFGDFLTKKTIKGDVVTAYYIRQKLGTKYPISSITNLMLDNASCAAMMQMQMPNKKYRLLPITHALDPFDKLFEFGKSLRDAIEDTKERIAVISLGDLAQASKKTIDQAKQIDQEIIKNLHDKDSNSFIKHRPDKVAAFSVRGFRPLAVILGLVDGMNYSFDLKGYEQKYGLGMMAATFAI
ncbi:MEMO1 family protein [Patescibacteria group bacterium]|nr:MEMO1 family protein [Patescibacteria group bacterium]